MTITDDTLTAILEAREAATPTPWALDDLDVWRKDARAALLKSGWGFARAALGEQT